MLVMNDSQYLYLALDVTANTVDDAGDYFWLSVDVDRNATITPSVDLNYGQHPGNPNDLGRQLYLGPGTWTGILSGPSDSMDAIGFGPSSALASDHRIWTVRLALAEIEGALAPGGSMIGFGLRTGTVTTGAALDEPNNFFSDFSALDQVVLATPGSIPSDVAGIVMAGVGLIPATLISDGYANVPAPYYVEPDDAVFAGVLNIVSNRATIEGLWAAGARRYRVQHQYAGGGYTPIDQGWTNYIWDGSTFVLEVVGPDANHTYPLQDPSVEYSINDLLLQWNSLGFPTGLHDFKVEFFHADMTPVTAPDQTLSLQLDNGLPQVHVTDIQHGGVSVPACSIVDMTGATDSVEVFITAYETNGHLYKWWIDAEWGDGASTLINSGSYPSPHPADHLWNGVTSLDAGSFVPPTTCAYQFRVSADMRATNGYIFPVGYATSYRNITLITPAASPPLARISSAMVAGMD
jgi:hypothetical protein